MTPTGASSSNSQDTQLNATLVDHPRLTKTDTLSIRTFLRAYDQYSKKIQDRARQLVGKSVVSTEAVTPVHLNVCVDLEWIESLIDLGFMEDVTSYDVLTEELLRT